jgi:hypothetical protein
MHCIMDMLAKGYFIDAGRQTLARHASEAHRDESVDASVASPQRTRQRSSVPLASQRCAPRTLAYLVCSAVALRSRFSRIRTCDITSLALASISLAPFTTLQQPRPSCCFFFNNPVTVG